MIKAVCVLAVDATGALGTTWVPAKGTIKFFEKNDTIQFLGLGGSPKIAFQESPFEKGATLVNRSYGGDEGQESGFSLTVLTDAEVDRRLAFSCKLTLPTGQDVTYAYGEGDDVPVKNP